MLEPAVLLFDESLAVSDQILVMDHGLIAQRGTPEQLYGRPESEFVASFRLSRGAHGMSVVPGA